MAKKSSERSVGTGSKRTRLLIDADAHSALLELRGRFSPSQQPGPFVSEILKVLRMHQAELALMLDPNAVIQSGKQKTDELQAYLQQVWYCLQGGAWYEALELGEFALKNCDVEEYAHSSDYLILGVAFSQLIAAFEVELEAYIESNRSFLKDAIQIVQRARVALVALREKVNKGNRDASVMGPHAMRIGYAEACTKAMEIRMSVEHEDSLFPRFKIPKNSSDRRADFASEWLKKVPYTTEDIDNHSEKVQLYVLGEEVVTLADRCMPTVFMKAHARKDPDLLIIATVEPWKKQFDISTGVDSKSDQLHHSDLKRYLSKRAN